jgi:hypothetical protein
MVRRADAPRGAADPVASAPRTERCAPHRPQPKAPVYRGQRAPISSMLAPPVPYGHSSRFQLPRAKSASPAPTAMPPRRFPLDVRERNAVACLSTFIQARETVARQGAGGAHDDARGGSTEYGGVGKGMQLAALGTDVHVTLTRSMRAAGGPSWHSGLALDNGPHPGADKHTAAGGGRPLLHAALDCRWLSAGLGSSGSCRVGAASSCARVRSGVQVCVSVGRLRGRTARARWQTDRRRGSRLDCVGWFRC